MLVQSCSFAHLNLLHFWRSRCRCRRRRRRRCFSSLVMCRDRANCCKNTRGLGREKAPSAAAVLFPGSRASSFSMILFSRRPCYLRSWCRLWERRHSIQKDQVRISAPYFFKKSTTSIYEMENVLCNLFMQHARISFLCKRKYTFSFSTF